MPIFLLSVFLEITRSRNLTLLGSALFDNNILPISDICVAGKTPRAHLKYIVLPCPASRLDPTPYACRVIRPGASPGAFLHRPIDPPSPEVVHVCPRSRRYVPGRARSGSRIVTGHKSVDVFVGRPAMRPPRGAQGLVAGSPTGRRATLRGDSIVRKTAAPGVPAGTRLPRC